MSSRSGDYSYESEPRADSHAGVVACPRCGIGRLMQHCPPGNRCGWWECSWGEGDTCGYRIDLTTGVEVTLRRGNPDVSFGRGYEDEADGEEEPGEGDLTGV